MPENAKIAYFHNQPSGCSWYRIHQPMNMLNANGIITQGIHLNEDMDDSPLVYQFYGATPFSRENIFKYLKSEGKRIIYDADDALDLIDTSNPFFYSVKKDLSSADEAIQYADEITVTTPEMRRYMEGKTNKKITIVPNCYTPSEWDFPRPKREGIRIGFSGSATHVADLIEIIPIIEKLQAKYPITFLIFGFGQTSYENWYREFRYVATEEARKDLLELDKRLSKIKFEWVPFVEYTVLPQTLINMSLDIGICPLRPTPFNICRSACKAMEYTLSGAIALASDVEPYRSEPTSILVKDGEWEDAIELMIKHPDVRSSFHKAHLLWIKKNRDIKTQLEPLKKIYLAL